MFISNHSVLSFRSEAKVSKKQKKERPEKEMIDRGKEKERLEKRIAIMDNEGFIEVTRVSRLGFYEYRF